MELQGPSCTVKKRKPTSLEDVENQPEWLARYKLAYGMLQKNPKNTSYNSVASELKIDKVILKTYVHKYHPEYKFRNETMMKSKIAEILADTELKQKFDDAVQQVLNDKKISWVVLAKQLGVSLSIFIAYVKHIEPNCAPSKINLMLKNVQEKVEMILIDPARKAKYDRLVEKYLTQPTTTLKRLCDTVSATTLKAYMDCTVPNHAQIRADLLAKSAETTMPSNDIAETTNEVPSKDLAKSAEATNQVSPSTVQKNGTTKVSSATQKTVVKSSVLATIKRTVTTSNTSRARSKATKQKLAKMTELYFTDPLMSQTRLSKINNISRFMFRTYLERNYPNYMTKREALLAQSGIPGLIKKPFTIPFKPTVKIVNGRNRVRKVWINPKYDEAIQKYLTDPTVSFTPLASILHIDRKTLKIYMEKTVPKHAEIRAQLLAKSNMRIVKMKKKLREQMRRNFMQTSKIAGKWTKTEKKPATTNTAEESCYVLDTSDEYRVRQFEDQGLCYDEVKNRVTCTSCDVILVSTDTEILSQHCQSRCHMDARNSQRFLETTAEVEIDLDQVTVLQHDDSDVEVEIDDEDFDASPRQDPLDISEEFDTFHFEAPKDSVGPGENSWAAQTSQAPMPSTSRAKEMSPRPSTSATHTGGFLIKQDPGTPPPVQQQVMNPYIQEPPMVQSAPRLLPKPSVPPPQSQVQQQPRLRVRQPQHVAPAPAPPDPDPEPQQVCLRWNSFHNNMQTMFPTLLNKEKFVDVTLACEGQTVKCHKVVLSSCSAYIERLLTENPCKHPIILMPNTMRYWQIRALVDFMYRGEVNVEHEQLSSLLAAAEFLQVKGLAGPPTSPEQNTNMEDPEPEPPLSPRPKRKRVASPSPVPQHRQPVATPPTPQPQQQQQQQQQRTSLPNSPAVSITRLKQSTAVAQATPSTSRDTGSRAQSPGIEITPVVSFEEIKMEPIDISDSNDESMDPNMHCDVDYDMDNGDGEGDKDYDDEDLDEDSGDAGRGAEDDTGGGGGDADPGPSLQPSTSDDQPGTSKTTSNGPDLTTPGFSGNGIEIDDSAASYCAADLGLTTEPPEDPPDSGAGPSGL